MVPLEYSNAYGVSDKHLIALDENRYELLKDNELLKSVYIQGFGTKENRHAFSQRLELIVVLQPNEKLSNTINTNVVKEIYIQLARLTKKFMYTQKCNNNGEIFHGFLFQNLPLTMNFEL